MRGIIKDIRPKIKLTKNSKANKAAKSFLNLSFSSRKITIGRPIRDITAATIKYISKILSFKNMKTPKAINESFKTALTILLDMFLFSTIQR